MKKPSEIIVRFKNNKVKEEFIAQLMDGFGENYTDFDIWHKVGDEYIKRYCPDGRLICTVNRIDIR